MAVDYLPLAIVAAVGRNGAIGRANALPWSVPSDLAHFRACTTGKPMIMGRRTFEAIGRALPGRETIVVTGGTAPLPAGVWRVRDIGEALALGQERGRAMGAGEIVLAGGATLFSALITQCDWLRMTFIDLAPAADTFFPAIDPALWREVSRVTVPPAPGDEAGCAFVDYARRQP